MNKPPNNYNGIKNLIKNNNNNIKYINNKTLKNILNNLIPY